MKVLQSNLKAEYDTWDDPGDYPNALAGGPMRSYDYVESISGEIRVELSPEELVEVVPLLAPDMEIEFKDWVDDHDIDYGWEDVCSFKWIKQLEGNILVLTVDDVESERVYDRRQTEREYDAVDEYERNLARQAVRDILD